MGSPSHAHLTRPAGYSRRNPLEENLRARELHRAEILGLRPHVAVAVVVAALDRDDVRALLAPMFRREPPRLKVGLGVAAPLATTAGETPVVCRVVQRTLLRLRGES